MIKRALIHRYSKALFNLDASNGHLQKRVDDFKYLLTLLKNQPKLMKFLKLPQVILEEKKTVLHSIFGDKFDTTFFQFLFYLIEKRRIDYLIQIALDYQEMVNEDLGIWEAMIITAIPIEIEKDLEKKLKEKLEHFYNKTIKIKKEIDPQIMGGAVLVIANEIIDWSVAHRLKKIKEDLLETTV